MKKLRALGVAAVALVTIFNAPSVMLGFAGHVQASSTASQLHTDSTHSRPTPASVCC
jgi:hypothetical protein